MVKIYAALVRKGIKTIGQVPEKIRAEVERILNSDKSPSQQNPA